MIIIPGGEETCSLCDEAAVGVMVVVVTAQAREDDAPEKVVQTEIELSVCKQHALSLTISLQKRLKPAIKRIITF